MTLAARAAYGATVFGSVAVLTGWAALDLAALAYRVWREARIAATTLTRPPPT